MMFMVVPQTLPLEIEKPLNNYMSFSSLGDSAHQSCLQRKITPSQEMLNGNKKNTTTGFPSWSDLRHTSPSIHMAA